jgi:hypothetical protein
MLSIAFLCNASSLTGAGHFMRCLALAEEFSGGRADCRSAGPHGNCPILEYGKRH